MTEGTGLPRGLTAEIVRPLTDADIALTVEARPGGIKKLRDSHHRLARMVAQGATLREMQDETGYCFSRISILKSDPTFSELIAFYRNKEIERNVDIIAENRRKMEFLLGDCIDEIRDTVNGEVPTCPPDYTLDTAKWASAAVGLGPQSKSLSIHGNLNDYASDVAASRRRAAEASAAPVAAKVALPSLPSPAGRPAPGDD